MEEAVGAEGRRRALAVGRKVMATAVGALVG